MRRLHAHIRPGARPSQPQRFVLSTAADAEAMATEWIACEEPVEVQQ